MNKRLMMLALGTMLAASARADTFMLSFVQNATDNLFQNRIAESDQLSSLGFSLDKSLGAVTLFSQGSYAHLYENPDLAYFAQDVGLDYVLATGERSALYFSLTGRGAWYRSSFQDFNYTAVNAYSAFKIYLHQTAILKSDYSFTYRHYRFSPFDYLSHSLYLSVDKYFQTRTTVKAAVQWGYKHYLQPFLETEDAAASTGSEPGGNKGMGNGQGYRWSQTTIIPGLQEQMNGQGIQKLALSGLIAQGISPAIGLRLSGLKQWSLSGRNPYTSVQEFYMVENPFYDQFAWEGYELGAQATMLLPWNLQLKIGYTYSRKEFPGILALDLEGGYTDTMREDRRHRIESRLSKDFSRFSVYLSYFNLNNLSNDPWFDWKGNFFSLGIEWKVFFGGTS